MSIPSIPYTRPGVYMQSVGSPSVLSPGVSGGVAALIGTAPKGSSQVGATLYTSLADVIRDYGDPAVATAQGYTIPIAALLYFSQATQGAGVRPGLMVERIGTSAAAAVLGAAGAGSLGVTTRPFYAGTAGNAVVVTVSAPVTTGNATSQQLSVTDGAGRTEVYTYTDTGLLQLAVPAVAPTAGAASGATTLAPSTTYLAAYAWGNAQGLTPPSPTVSFTTAASPTAQPLTVPVAPSGATTLFVYLQAAGGAMLLNQTVANPSTSGTTAVVVSAPSPAAAAVPSAVNSTGSESVQGYYAPSQFASFLTSGAGNQASLLLTATAGGTVNGGWLTAGTVTCSGGYDGLGTAIAQAHFDALGTNPLIDGVVPCDGSATTLSLAQAHVATMSNNYAKPRVAFLGPNMLGQGGDHVTPLVTAVGTLGDPSGRTVFFGHDSILMFNPSSPSVVSQQPGWLGAVALAGAKFSGPTYMPLTRRPLYGIVGPGTPLTESQLDTLAQAGCTVLTTTYGGLVVRQGITTAGANSAYWNLGVRSAEDEFAKRLRNFFELDVIGKPEDQNTPGNIQSGAAAVANQAILDGVITGIGALPTPSSLSPGNWLLPVPYAPRWETDMLTIQLATLH